MEGFLCLRFDVAYPNMVGKRSLDQRLDALTNKHINSTNGSFTTNTA